MRICRDDANTLFTRRRFYPNPTTCASSRNRLSMSWNPNFPKISLISSTESCSTFRFKSFTFAPSSSKNSRYIGLPFCHSTETFSPNRTRFSTSCFRSFFNSGCEFKRHPGQEMNFAECTRESSSSDGWNADDSEDEENAKHIVGELKSNDRPTRKSRRIPPLCWVWKKRRRFRDGVKAAAIIISRFARFARRRPSSVRSKLCAVIQSQRFCVENVAHLHEPLVAWRKKMASRSSFFVHHKRHKKNRESFHHRAAKNALFFLVSLSFLCPFVKHPANDETTFYTPRSDGACTQKNTLFRVSLRSKFFFFFFFKNLAREKRHFFLSLSSLISLSLSKEDDDDEDEDDEDDEETERQRRRKRRRRRRRRRRRDDDEYRVSSPRAL